MTDELQKRAEFLADYWEGTLHSEVIRFFIRLGDAKHLEIAVKRADNAMFDSEYNPNE